MSGGVKKHEKNAKKQATKRMDSFFKKSNMFLDIILFSSFYIYNSKKWICLPSFPCINKMRMKKHILLSVFNIIITFVFLQYVFVSKANMCCLQKCDGCASKKYGVFVKKNKWKKKHSIINYAYKNIADFHKILWKSEYMESTFSIDSFCWK